MSVKYELQVPFYDVDSYRIVWHGNYPKYFEVARCQLLEEIGFAYAKMEESGYFFPIIDLNIKYVHPIVFNQEVEVSAELKHWQDKLVIDYRITDLSSRKVLTKARSTQIAVKMPEHITQFKAPSAFIEAVEKWLSKAE